MTDMQRLQKLAAAFGLKRARLPDGTWVLTPVEESATLAGILGPGVVLEEIRIGAGVDAEGHGRLGAAALSGDASADVDAAGERLRAALIEMGCTPPESKDEYILAATPIATDLVSRLSEAHDQALQDPMLGLMVALRLLRGTIGLVTMHADPSVLHVLHKHVLADVQSFLEEARPFAGQRKGGGDKGVLH